MKHDRMNVEHDRLPPKCGNTFWIVPSDNKRRVAPNHPGAVEITCGRCLRCLITKRNIHVGRMIAEQLGSEASVMLTLTFRPEVELPEVPGTEYGPAVPDKWKLPNGKPYWKARWKAYWAEARKYWVPFRKSLRKRYGQGEYCGAGELGDMRGRLHFHTGLYFGKGQKIPAWVDLPRRVERDYIDAVRRGLVDADGCFQCCGVKVKRQYSVKGKEDNFIAWLPEWPHGYVHIGEMTAASAGYIAKYLMKPADAATLRGPNSPHNSYATKVFRSHKLGYRYVREWGEKAAREGLCPTSSYRLPGQVVASGPGKGRAREYRMTRGMKRECGRAHLRTVASMLAKGELRSWRAANELAKGFLVPELLEADARRDPRVSVEKFLTKLAKEKRGQWSLPYFDLGGVVRAVSTPGGGVVSKTTRGELVFSWPDLSGHGRDIHIPIETRRELFRAVRLGGVEAFGFHPPDVRLVEREAIPGKRRRGQVLAVGGAAVWPLRQVLEHDGAGIADDETRAAVVASGGRLLVKSVRAWVTDRQIEELRRRIVRVYVVRWCPPAAELARRGVGLPTLWAGRSLTPEDEERFPLWAKWIREADPNVPPF